MLALREPSLGPVFGVKGGAAGGGYAQVVPMEDINLHFTGDIHAITAANNLLSALVDAHIFHGHEPAIETVTWRRAIDVTDRSLRNIVTGLGGRKNGVPAESGFDITAASEVMAILALATDVKDLRRRLGAITVGYTSAGEPVTAEQVQAAGAMAVLLKEAIKPNLVQTLEGQLCLMHAGPFANIAHGNNSIIADRVGLKLGEYLITESGFAADLGMEKFMDIVCRVGGLKPHVVVVVATVRALRHHGGGDYKTKADMAQMRAEVETGMANLAKHIENVRAFGIQPVVAINTRPDDEPELLELIKERSLEAGAFGAAIHDGFGQGGEGTIELAEVVVAAADAAVRLRDALRRRRADRHEDREDRDDRLRRRRDRPRPRGARLDRPLREAGARAPADLHGEDAPLAVARPDAAQPPVGVHRADPRHPRLLGRRDARAALRRHAADAGLRRPARRVRDRHRRRRGDGRAVLACETWAPLSGAPSAGIPGSRLRRTRGQIPEVACCLRQRPGAWCGSRGVGSGAGGAGA